MLSAVPQMVYSTGRGKSSSLAVLVMVKDPIDPLTIFVLFLFILSMVLGIALAVLYCITVPGPLRAFVVFFILFVCVYGDMTRALAMVTLSILQPSFESPSNCQKGTYRFSRIKRPLKSMLPTAGVGEL